MRKKKKMNMMMIIKIINYPNNIFPYVVYNI